MTNIRHQQKFIMSNRQNPKKFTPYTIPKKANTKPEEQEEDTKASSSSIPASITIPAPKLTNIQSEASSADESVAAPSSKRARVKSESNLCITDDSYSLISKYLTRIRPLITKRETLAKSHKSIAGDINSGGTSRFTRVPEQPLAIPQGVILPSAVLTNYRTKAKDYARRLALIIATEYQSQIAQLTKDIAAAVAEAENTINLICDEIDREKAVQLFRVKLSSHTRRAQQPQAHRRRVYAVRKADRQEKAPAK